MDLTTLLVLLFSGCVTGFLAGLFGVGGGVVLVPILLLVFTATLNVSSLVATHLTFGTSLFVVAFASLSSAYEYYKNGYVVSKAVLAIGIASIIAAFAGATLAASLQGNVLQGIFAIVVAGAAFRLLVEPELSRPEANMTLATGPMVLIGVVAGLVSSLAGVGGGVFSIPMMYYLLRFPVKKALGSSSAAIVLTSLVATVGYVVNGLGNPDLERYPFVLGFVDYLHAIPVIVGTIPLAKLGARVAHRMKSDRLRKLFAVFLFVVAVKMFFT